MGRLIYYSILFIGIFIFNQAFSQETQLLNGRIIADSIDVREVNVINLNSKTGTLSLPDGTFELNVTKGDSLFFSSLQYEPYQLLITEEVLQKKRVDVYLFPLVNELEEVNISDLNLSGDIAKDLEGIKVNPFFDPATKGLPVRTGRELTTAERRIHTASTGSGIIPLDPIINHFTGRMAMLHRQRRYEKEQNAVSAGINAMPPSFFKEELEIPEAYTEDFMYYCMTFKPFAILVVQKSRKMELIEFFKEKAITYKKLKEFD